MTAHSTINRRRGHRLGLAAAALLGAGSLAACSGAAGNSGDTQTLRAGVIYTPDVPVVRCGLEPLADDEQLAKVGLEIQTTDSAQLGTEDELVQQASTGQLDIALAAGSTLATEFDIPELAMFEAYYLYDNLEDVIAARQTEVGQQAWGKLPKQANLQIVGDPWLYGERHVFGNEELHGPADFRGVKFRVPETEISIASARALGASPTPTAYDELYLALEQGIVDVAEAPLSVIEAESLDEPSSVVNLTGHLVTAASPLINHDVWTSLSPQQQKALDAEFDQASQRVAKCVEQADQDALDKWREAGTPRINEDVDREALRRLAEQAYTTNQPWSDKYRRLVDELHG